MDDKFFKERKKSEKESKDHRPTPPTTPTVARGGPPAAAAAAPAAGVVPPVGHPQDQARAGGRHGQDGPQDAAVAAVAAIPSAPPSPLQILREAAWASFNSTAPAQEIFEHFERLLAAAGSDGLLRSDVLGHSIVLLGLDRVLDAIEGFSRVLEMELTDDDHQMREGRGAVLHRRGNAFFSLGNFARANEDYSEAIRIGHSLTESYVFRGNSYREMGKTDEAMKDLDEALRLGPRAPEVRFTRGLLYRDIGELKKAVQEFDRALELDEGFADALVERGRAHELLKEHVLALRDHTLAIQLAPSDPHAYNLRGHVHYTADDFSAAIEDYSKAIQLDPTLGISYRFRGNARRCKGDFEEALADMSEAIRRRPDDGHAVDIRGMIYHSLGRFDDAVADFTQSLSRDPADKLEVLVARGHSYTGRKDFDSAIADYTEALRLSPDLTACYQFRGSCWRMKKEFEKAEHDLVIAVERDPSDNDAHSSLGIVYHAQKRFKEAIAEFSTVLKTRPHDDEALDNRGLCYHELGEFDAALRDLTEALRLQSAAPMASTVISRGHVYFALERYSMAIADYSEALRLNKGHPQNGLMYRFRGNCFRCKHDYELALKDLMIAAELVPTDAETFLIRGMAYHDSASSADQVRLAIADYTEALRLKLETRRAATALACRGQAYQELGEFEPAIADTKASISLCPEAPRPWIIRGHCHHSLKDYTAARADYTEALRLNPENVNVFRFRGNSAKNCGDFEAAKKDLEEAMKAQPNDWRIHHTMGLVLIEMKDERGALASFTEGVRCAPDYFDCYLCRAQVYHELNEEDLALKDFAEAFRLKPELQQDPFFLRVRGHSYYESNDFASSIRDYTASLALQKSAGTLRCRGNAYRLLGQPDLALKDLHEAISLNATEPLLFDARGLVLAVLGKHGLAVKDYDAALQLDASRPDVLFHRAQSLYELDKFDLAVEDCTKALQMSPTDVELITVRGHCYHAMKKYDLAKADYTTAIELKPGALLYRYRANSVRNAGDLDAAKKDMEQAARFGGAKDWEALRVRSLIHVEAGEFVEGKRDLTDAIQAYPEGANPIILGDMYATLGSVDREVGDFESAIHNFTEALQLLPPDPILLSTRGHVYFRKGDFSRAVIDYTEAIEMMRPEEDAALYRFCGNARLQLEDYPLALKDISKSIELDPSNAESHFMRGLALCESGMSSDSLPSFEKARELEPAAPCHHLFLCREYVRLCKFDEAEKGLDAAKDVMGDGRWAVESAVLRLRVLYGRREYLKVEEMVAELLQSHPEEHEAHRVRAIARCCRRKFDAAMEDHDACIRLAPENTSYREARALCYCYLGNADAAEKEFAERDKMLPPAGSFAKFYRATGLFALQKYEASLAVNTELLGVKLPDDGWKSDVHWMRSFILFQLGRDDEARVEFEKAYNFDPTLRRVVTDIYRLSDVSSSMDRFLQAMPEGPARSLLSAAAADWRKKSF